MENCLAGGFYDEPFKAREAEIWWLGELSSSFPDALAAVALDTRTRPFGIWDAEGPNNTPVAVELAQDVRALFEHRTTVAPVEGSGVLAHLGLFGPVDIWEDEPEFYLKQHPPTRVWRHESGRRGPCLYLHQPGRGIAEVRLGQITKIDAALDCISSIAADRPDAGTPGLRWLGRALQCLLQQRPKLREARAVRKLPNFVNGIWWADAERIPRKIARRRYWITEAGVTPTHPADAELVSPHWSVRTGERAEWKNVDLLPRKAAVLQDKKFWALLDPEAERVGFLGRMMPDRDGRPRLA
jgi:hypothetical protein